MHQTADGHRAIDASPSSLVPTARATRPQRMRVWVVQFFVTFAVILGAVSLFNFVTDPFTLYRRDGLYLTDTRFQRDVGAGLLRTADNPTALIVGNSYFANFTPEGAGGLLGVKTEISSQWGMNQGPINKVVRYALDHQPSIKTVYLATSIWDSCQVDPHPTSPLPKSLYSGYYWADLEYLMSYETVEYSYLKVSGSEHFSRDPLAIFSWWERYKSINGDVAYLESLRDKMSIPDSKREPANLNAESGRLSDCFKAFASDFAREYPSVFFYYVNPPLHQWLLHQRWMYGVLETQLAAMDEIGRFISSLPNAAYFDFYAAKEWTTDCSHWRDMSHFDPFVGQEILKAIATGSYQRTAATNEGLTARTIQSVQQSVECD